MKIRLKKLCTTDGKTYTKGVYSVPGEMPRELAEAVIRIGWGVEVVEKRAPENKLSEVPENKLGVDVPGRRRRKRPKPAGDAEA